MNSNEIYKEINYLIKSKNKKKMLEIVKILIENNENLTIKQDCVLFDYNKLGYLSKLKICILLNILI